MCRASALHWKHSLTSNISTYAVIAPGLSDCRLIQRCLLDNELDSECMTQLAPALGALEHLKLLHLGGTSECACYTRSSHGALMERCVCIVQITLSALQESRFCLLHCASWWGLST